MISAGSGTYNSGYLKTKVIPELEECSSTVFNDPLSHSTSLNVISCGVECSSDETCRRFMFDSQTNQCTLFDSGENCITDETIANKVCYRQEFVCNEKNCSRCPIGYYGDQCQHIITDCGNVSSTITLPDRYMLVFIRPSDAGPVLEVKCLGKKTIIHHRTKFCHDVDFNRTWAEYREGFGKVHGEYWLGLKHVHKIIQNNGQECTLRVQLHFNPVIQAVQYQSAVLTNQSDSYRILLSGSNARVNETDYLTGGAYSIDGRPFSTYDRDSSGYSCPGRFNGGWWYPENVNCSLINPVGRRSYDGSEDSFRWDDLQLTSTQFYALRLFLSC
ncbi:hypothetical protein SNE40_005397 [Patella caerulea]